MIKPDFKEVLFLVCAYIESNNPLFFYKMNQPWFYMSLNKTKFWKIENWVFFKKLSLERIMHTCT